ncbi:MAG: zinc-binding dehydrogenase [Clostridia bacterium]|nr:zinc-binding dehydrogenase [Deltaproteobacteria bacterium]
MKRVWMTRVGAPEVLELREEADPTPQDGEVRIRVEAAGVNFAEVMARIGVYPDAPKLPAVMGYEVAGIVNASRVSSIAVGTRVVALTRFGGYTDTICVPAAQVFAIPDDLAFTDAAALPVNGVTAYDAMVVMGALKKGERFLVHGGAGGVGLLAIDIAKIIGAEIFATASSGKHEFLKTRGVNHCIDYHSQNFEAEVKRITNGRGVHLIIDPIGGKSWEKSLNALGPTGRMAVIGFSGAATTKGRNPIAALKNLIAVPWRKFSPLSLMNANKAVIGINVGHLWNDSELVRTWMNQILTWTAEGKIRPHVGQTFPLAEAAKAHHCLQDRKNVGKVVLVSA